MGPELFGIFAHWEMAKLAHDDQLCPRDSLCRSLAVFRGAGVVVFSREHVNRTFCRVDGIKLVAHIPLDLEEIQIALEDPRASLHIMP